MKILVTILMTLLIIAALLFIKTLLKLKVTKRRVDRELGQTIVRKISDPGTVPSFSLLPLVDYLTDDPRFKTEAGVSYWISAGDTSLLMDLGANAKKEHPSPLMHNMALAGKKTDELDAIYISHTHLDHVGGMREQKNKQFSFSKGPIPLPQLTVYAPEPMTPSENNPGPHVQVLTEPTRIKAGIVSIGAIPRALYLMGYTLENALAFNVEGKGIVLVIGCGHQTIQRIIERVKALFDEPIYAIIGGLHLPAGGGRMKIGPIDIQPVVGTDRPPWNMINDQDTQDAIAAVQAVNPALVALSPHDSSDRSLDRFKAVFGEKFQTIKVGTPITI